MKIPSVRVNGGQRKVSVTALAAGRRGRRESALTPTKHKELKVCFRIPKSPDVCPHVNLGHVERWITEDRQLEIKMSPSLLKWLSICVPWVC